ncbi:protein NRT1/ PTR FAMILY 5.10-like [Prunus yedoensis var. nudiflora]|uniref:Protein NRT1/ PTR FAMILY 5.10-like n=1 Tax=Prunus yedoensis var. nudiflora TaxID=2094558 RepID=A0A314UDL0_PRUYE|nr:protein NRT1/ PTR FAMILY 5.10-like [Prunus yedoensis var. nudiflora]
MRGFDRADSIVWRQSVIRLGLIWSRCNILPCQCIDSVRKWLGNHFYFSKATTPIRGLVISHSYVNHALVSILITYLTDKWRTSNFAMAALVTNVQEGVSDILVIVLARISDTHMTRFKMIVSTNAAYFLGLLLLWICSEFVSSQTVAKIYYGAVVLIVLGEAGRSATLKEFLENQYFSEDKERPSTDENYLKRLETRKEALWHHPWFLGALLAVFLPTPTWTITLMVSTILVGVSYLLFLLGYSCYFVSSRIDEYSTWKSRLDYLKKLSPVYPVEQEEEEEERRRDLHGHKSDLVLLELVSTRRSAKKKVLATH